MRGAIYARFSSDLQRETSIEDQVAAAMRYAVSQGWTVDPSCVFTDYGLSGSGLDRPGLQALLDAGTVLHPRFDVLLVEDSSRVSRDLADAVRVLQQLSFAGVRVLYMAQHIDSANEQAETLLAIHGVVDSLYVKEMGKRVWRGIAGQLRRGYSPGAKTFGYRSSPVIDPTGKRDMRTGYPALLGKRVHVHRAEAQIIKQIFIWYAAGLGINAIVLRLNHRRCSAPGGRHWRRKTVLYVLQNERYLGKLIWGRTRLVRRPGTNRRSVRHIPRAEWVEKTIPELAVISPALWARVQARRAKVRVACMRTQAGPPPADEFSRALFCGFLQCGVCGASLTEISRAAQYGPRYGCARCHRDGSMFCSNRLTIRARLADPILAVVLLEQSATAARTLIDAAFALPVRLHGRRRGPPCPLDVRIMTVLQDASAPGFTGATVLARLARVLARDREAIRDQFKRLAVLIRMKPMRDRGRPFYRATVHIGAAPSLGGVIQDSDSEVPVRIVVDLPSSRTYAPRRDPSEHHGRKPSVSATDS
jgi:DNA invertase Pin-like site-specific DNA recombinase